MKEKKENAVIKMALRQKWKLLLTVIFNVISTMGRIAIYYFIYLIIKEIVDKHAIIENIDFALINKLCLEMGGCVIAAVVLTAISSYMAHGAAYALGYDIRNGIMTKLSKIELGYFTNNRSGEIKKAISEDCGNIEEFFAEHLGDVVSGVLTPICLLILMFQIDVKMSLAAIISIPFALFASAMLYLNKKYMKANKEYNVAMGNITADAVEYFKALPVVRIFNSKRKSEEMLRRDIDDIYEATCGQGRHSMVGYTFFTTFITASLLGILPMSVYEYYMGADYWVLLSKIMFFYIVGANLAGPLMNLAILSISLTKFGVASENINEILTLSEVEVRPAREVQKGYDITFEDVEFGYEEKQILKGCKMDIPEGKTTAVIGASGAGKTTLAHLIAGFWNNYKGDIKIGGKSIRAMTSRELYSQVAFVFQENYILSDTVEANIRMNNTEATMDEIVEAAKKAQIHELIMSLPKQYKTIIGDGGHELSGGEKQRIAISRLFLKNAPILILDEATSYADAENEELINNALAELSKGKTVVMIAHKLPTIKNADKIVVISDGKVSASGTDLQLRSSSEFYNHLWDRYYEGTNWILERSVK